MVQVCRVYSSFQLWDNRWTDRRHGQEVLRSHTDFFSKLMKLVVTLSVKLKELEDVKSYHEQKTQAIISSPELKVIFIWLMVRCSPSAWAQSNSGHTP